MQERWTAGEGEVVGRQVVRFSGFEVDLRSRELRNAGGRVRLQDQPFEILSMLLERPGDVVTRHEIRERLWPNGTFVDFEHSMNAAVKRLRAALGDAAEQPRFVETLHRRGYRFVAPVSRAGDPTGPVSRAGDLTGPVSRASETIVHSASTPQTPPAVSTPRRPRLVVLPFANLSGDRTPDYFSDGLTEEMIAQVGRRCANRIGVLARHSSMRYKNAERAAGDIGEALRADYLVEGSVRREGDRLRITARLVETRGETQLWAESYDAEMSDCLTVQTKVAVHIAHALTRELLPASSGEYAETHDPRAYQAFLRGRFHWNRPGDEGLEAAVASYDEALSLDPRLGKAYTARARARIALCDYYRAEPRSALKAALADAERALELDGVDAEAHLAVGEVKRTIDWDWAGAELAYRTALSVNPSCEAAHRYYAVFLAARGRGEAPAMADRAWDLDPLCLTMNTAAAIVYYFRGDYETAIERYHRTLGIDPEFVPARRGLAAALVQLDRAGEAVALLTSVPSERLDPVSQAWLGHALATDGRKAEARRMAHALATPRGGHSAVPFHLALLYAGLEDLDGAFRALDRACEVRDPWLDAMAVEPRLWILRGDPRYTRLIRRLGLAG